MGIILWIIFGGLTGWIASLLMKSEMQHDLLLNIVVGIIGAILGGWLMNILGQGAVTGFNFYSFVVALLGAIIFIVIIRAFRKMVL
jgi:uncharacterized membrane protein YeaQ/YmgE (transglycosylase-associated protein family)